MVGRGRPRRRGRVYRNIAAERAANRLRNTTTGLQWRLVKDGRVSRADPGHLAMNQVVKQERQDDPEIAAMAAKMLEANKNKVASQQKAPVTPVQSMNILSFMQQDKKGKSNGQASGSTSNDIQKNIDEESLRGRFGWTTIGKVHIPYIMRSSENYVSVRMVEMKLLNKYLSYLHQDIYNCTCVRSYYITEAEGRLLNEINLRHCDYQFGREQFTSRDLIVRLIDAQEFYKFLSSCYAKLVNGETNCLDRCGFIRINKESVVPYTMYNNQKVVPLFYFEGETENLKLKADKLEGWDLSYLKFCCKVQGIRNELFAHDSCSVISLSDIKNYFPPGTDFEDYWPKKNVDSQLLISGNSRSQTQIVQWTRQPTAPPMPTPSPKPATQARAATNNQMHNVHVYNYGASGGQPSYYGPQTRAASSATGIRTNYQAPSATRQMRPCLHYSNMPQAPPPLIRASQPQNSYSNSQSNAASNYMVLGDSNIPQSNYHQAASQMKNYPPPLVDVRHMNGGITRYDTPPQTRYGLDVVDLSAPSRDLNNYGVQNNQAQQQMINQQPAHQQTTHQQPARTQTPTMSEECLYNGFNFNTMSRKLVPIPDPPTSGTHIPYKIQKALVEGQMVPCINMKPYVYTELLITVSDFCSYFFSNIPIGSCQQVMQVLQLELYKPNNSQMQVLLENGKCQTLNDTIPLVLVRNVIDYMPQLKYMLGTMDVGAKRQRNS